ncbi:hypothetical protein ACFL59_11400 [Planctomycetota bacterium]
MAKHKRVVRRSSSGTRQRAEALRPANKTLPIVFGIVMALGVAVLVLFILLGN